VNRRWHVDTSKQLSKDIFMRRPNRVKCLRNAEERLRTQNGAEAAFWYFKTAGYGYAAAHARLGLMYVQGRGPARIDPEAVTGTVSVTEV
jgi:TPR repeat protein